MTQMDKFKLTIAGLIVVTLYAATLWVSVEYFMRPSVEYYGHTFSDLQLYLITLGLGWTSFGAIVGLMAGKVKGYAAWLCHAILAAVSITGTYFCTPAVVMWFTDGPSAQTIFWTSAIFCGLTFTSMQGNIFLARHKY